MIRSLISRFKYWVFLIGLALWPHESVAQYVWNTAHTDFEGNRFYCFSAITSYGNSCIAGGSIIDTTEHSTERAIFRSEDAGRSWVVFHPESPIKNNIYWTGDSSYYRLIAQIDSLRIVAVGSIGDGSPIRSSDAGQTWHPILSGYNGFVISMDFSGSTGFILAAENIVDSIKVDSIKRIPLIYYGAGPMKFFTTNDGGATWDSIDAPMSIPSNGFVAHTYGQGHFGFFVPGHGRLYTTTDSWHTYDSTNLFIDSVIDPYNYYVFSGCAFAGSDTVIAYGKFSFSGQSSDDKGVMIQSTDGGNSWSDATYFPEVPLIEYMSSLERDTVFATGLGAGYYLMSTDRGTTWEADTILLDTNYTSLSSQGVITTASGVPIMILSPRPDVPTIRSYTIPTIIVRGEVAKSSVEYDQPLQFHDRIFPNPATTVMKIASIESSTQYQLLDVLGRVVKTGMVGDHTTISVDVSNLDRGCYMLVVNSPSGVPVVAGKLSLVW